MYYVFKRLELTHKGLLVELVNHYITQGVKEVVVVVVAATVRTLVGCLGFMAYQPL